MCPSHLGLNRQLGGTCTLLLASMLWAGLQKVPGTLDKESILRSLSDPSASISPPHHLLIRTALHNQSQPFARKAGKGQVFSSPYTACFSHSNFLLAPFP